MLRWLCAVLACFPLGAFAAEVAGVKVPGTVEVAGQALRLNGAGLRQKAFFKIYVAALYLPARLNGAAQVLAQGGAKRISMVTLRDITAQQLIDALHKGLSENHTAAELEKLRAGVDALDRIMREIGSAKTGSVITLDYVPGSGTQVGLNGTAHGAPIAGEAFYRGLMKIWLGEDPADEGLKRALLGT